ncbi:MAG: hypothetical protein H6831_13285 [Planctomycetes bacterium]|nr:hypothetical protein [Planctomycetota bacterium]MCB9905373.1 hypothetical protein [Planctomycetota bacterium]
MIRQRTKYAASALALPLLVAFGARGEKLAFAPADGSTLDRELSMEVSLYVEDLSMIVDGQDMGGMMMGELDEALTMSAVIKVTDEFVKTAGGKHVELLRTYNELSAEGGTESDREAADGFDALEDSTIQFKWDEEEGVYKKSYHESEGDEDLLENLEVDMDFTALLPDGEVSEGDTWEMDGSEALSLFAPGGFPQGGGEQDDEVMELVSQELESQFDEAFEDFTIECTYKGLREDGDASFGEIAFEFEGEGAIDLSELLMSMIDLQAEGAEVEIDADITAGLDLSFKGTGTLLWDPATGHLHSYEMSCEMTLLADVDASIDVMGQSQQFEASAELSGTGAWTMTTGSGE